MFAYILYVIFNHFPNFMSFVHMSRFHFKTTLSLSKYIYIYMMFIYRISQHGGNIGQLNHWGAGFFVFKLGHRNQRFLLDYVFTLGGENPLGDEEKEHPNTGNRWEPMGTSPNEQNSLESLLQKWWIGLTHGQNLKRPRDLSWLLC